MVLVGLTFLDFSKQNNLSYGKLFARDLNSGKNGGEKAT